MNIFRSFLIVLFFTFSLHADDLCYEDPYVSGFFLFPKNTIPIKHTNNGTVLEDVKIIYAISGFSFSFMEKIGIDGNTFSATVGDDDAERNSLISMNFGTGMPNFSMFDKGYNYYLHQMSNGEVQETWTSEFFFTNWMSEFFSSTKLFAEYYKDGEFYRVILNPCSGNDVTVPTVSVADASMQSPTTDTTMTFSVTLSGTLSSEIGTESYIHYKTVDDTAVAGVDYVAVDNTLVVPAGTTSADINVTIKAGASGKFKLLLDNAYGASINDGEAIGSIFEEFNMCYDNSTADNITNGKCVPAGSFYFAGTNQHDCNSETTIVNQHTSEALSSVVVTKLYKSDADQGSCTGSYCSGAPTSQNISGYTDYQGGYTYTIGTISADANVTIADSDTYYTAEDITDIVLYGSYTKDGLTYAQEISSCGGGSGVIIDPSLYTANVDIVDTIINTQYEAVINTKISNKPNYQMKAYYLAETINDTPDADAVYTGDIDMTIKYYLTDAVSNSEEDCNAGSTIPLYTEPNGTTSVVSIITDGDSYATSNSFTMAYTPALLSKKNVRFKYRAVDFNGLIDAAGISCPNSSINGSASGTVTGIPACVISNSLESTPAERYKKIFGDAAFNRCWEDILNGEPCNSNTNQSDLPVGMYDDPEYACMECSLADFPFVCSTDNFAIRPNEFAIASTDLDFPNLLRSAEDYNLTVYAYDYGGTIESEDYNITSATSIFDLNTTKYMKNGDINASMHGVAVWSAYDFNMSDGVSWSNAAIGSEVAGTQFDDVGKINLQVIDDDWAAVDINNPNDPTPHDCSANGAYICGDINITYIPHHFDFADLNVTNNNGNPGTFTYIANEVDQMAGRIHTRMRALNADGGVTQNFATFPLWENNVTVVPIVTTSKYIYTGANETNITNLAIGFSNGEKTIVWNENNTSQYLRFNFQRDVNLTANPFDVNGSDLNITLISSYVDPSDGDTTNINGSRLSTIQPADGNVTFLYGRTHATRQRYRVPEDAPYPANIYFESFCLGCDKNLLPNGVASKNTDDVRWFINEDHNTTNDGIASNVTEKKSTPVVTASPLTTFITPTLQRTNLTYNGTKGYPYKTTMQNEASPWLIYNEDDPFATTNEFQVEFNSQGDWTGDNETNTTTDTRTDKASTNRRIMW